MPKQIIKKFFIKKVPLISFLTRFLILIINKISISPNKICSIPTQSEIAVFNTFLL